MIDRIEQIVNDIDHYFRSEMYKYEGIRFTSDELRFIQKCLLQFQQILIKETHKDE